MIRIVNQRTGDVLADRAQIAATLGARLRGLMWRSPLRTGEGLILTRCRGVHTWFLRGPIDVLLLDPSNDVLHACRTLRPYRFSPLRWRARTVVELPAGGACGTQLGDHLQFERNGA